MSVTAPGAAAGPFAVKPIVTDAPGASAGAQPGAAAVTVVPACVTVAFQPLASVVPAGHVQVARHGLSAPPPVLVTVSSPWKPPCQVLTLR